MNFLIASSYCACHGHAVQNIFNHKNSQTLGASLVAQWLRIRLPMQGTLQLEKVRAQQQRPNTAKNKNVFKLINFKKNLKPRVNRANYYI